MSTNDEDRKAAEGAAIEHLRRHEELELEYSPSAHIGIFLAGVAHARRWIPVKERLPEREGRYLVSPVGKYYGEILNYNKYATRDLPANCFWHECGGMYHSEEPTHWMPLPPEPKEGG